MSNETISGTEISLPETLDRWYLSVNSIYLDRNFYRDASSIFTHLVEIVGSLSLLATEKTKPAVDPERYIPKALAWWMALCGKVGVRSVENMLWAKFPGVCSYCHRNVHERMLCLEKKRTPPSPDWQRLAELGEQNASLRPKTLDDWLAMFARIYPASDTEQYPATFGRFSEELGELAEAVRVFPVAPGYFLSEGADLFAWLMHLHGIVSAKNHANGRARLPGLQQGLAEMYPGRCNDCDRPVCSCPPILPKTLGRIANEVPTTGSPFAPGGALLSTSEALALFSIGAREVLVGASSVPVTEDLVRGIHSLVAAIRTELQLQRNKLTNVSNNVYEMLARVQESADSQRLTQEQITELTTALQSMPSEARSIVMNILGNIAAAPWTEALMFLLK
jgi:hypothetical protein